MPDVSLTEFAVIGLVVLIVFGPQRLPEIARKAGEWARELRSISREFRRGIEREVAVLNEPLQEIKKDLAGPVEQIKQDLKEPLEQINDELKSVEEDVSAAWVGPVAEIGPSPSEAMEDLDRIESGENLLDGEDD
ncbi:MAG: twin-arginine translocase TatA/TatE family subunit [Acidimicrobiia bacterium]